ncbi:conjugal transfer protein MobB [Flavobacterium psychrotrophum]|uniref:conjugal transfer protein MobB n=1 Tax=Flavobacterium psychrotrophum TaxID=2294119 RepID=UPI000E320AD3|nr:conjugal transfer protein MobB [Flavobacterium psychrotrophum]
MIAKIGKGMNIFGAVSYNQLKVDKQNGKILLAHKIPDPNDGNFTVAQICRAFEPYLLANNKTEKPVRHISLNPDPSDKVSDDRFMQMAEQYMMEMGYATQPYIVYKHNDIERTHIHIVTTCVQLDGSKIPDNYDHHRSMAACRNLEKAFNLIPADEKTQRNEKTVFKPVDYIKGDVKSQMAAVIRYLPKYYSFPNLGTYNALLSLFNITAEPISGEANGVTKKGLVYFTLDTKGEKTSKPFKSSLFGKYAGLESLEMHFEKSKTVMAKHPSRTLLKNSIEAAMHMANSESNFKRQLLEQGINVVVRRNNESRVYGITFIDHESRSVWNGSQLGKTLSANVFNDWWNNGIKINSDIAQVNKLSPSPVYNDEKDPFEFLTPTRNDGIFEALGSLLPDSQGEDYEERDFENRMKKKRKYRRGQS